MLLIVLIKVGLHLPRVVEPHEHDGDALDGDDAAQEVDVGELVALAGEGVAVVVQHGHRQQDQGVPHRHDVERGTAHVFLECVVDIA